MILVTASRSMSAFEIESIMQRLGETTHETNPTIDPNSGGGSGGGATGAMDTTVYTREASTCPPGRTCALAGDANGMFVRDVANNRIYFSNAGYDRAAEGANIDWAGVAQDLLTIISGAGGGVNLGVWGIMFYYAGLAAWGLEYTVGGGNE